MKKILKTNVFGRSGIILLYIVLVGFCVQSCRFARTEKERELYAIADEINRQKKSGSHFLGPMPLADFDAGDNTFTLLFSNVDVGSKKLSMEKNCQNIKKRVTSTFLKNKPDTLIKILSDYEVTLIVNYFNNHLRKTFTIEYSPSELQDLWEESNKNYSKNNTH